MDANSIDHQSLKPQMVFTIEVSDFQEIARTQMPKKILGNTILLFFAKARLLHFEFEKKIV